MLSKTHAFRILLLCLFFLTNNSVLTACSCYNLQAFLGNVTKRTHISKVKVIEHGSIDIAAVQKDLSESNKVNKASVTKPKHPVDYHSYTKLIITDQLLGSNEQDTLMFLNGSGAMCLASLENTPVGKEFVLRYSETETKTTTQEVIRNQLQTPHKLVSGSACHTWKLDLSQGYVHGVIFTPKAQLALKAFHEISGSLTPLEREKRLQEIQSIKEDKITYSALEGKLEEIGNVLNNL